MTLETSRLSETLATLEAAYASHAPLREASGPVIGMVGQDVPGELITAVGATALRLRGEPGRDTAVADHYLGTGLDPATRSLLTLLLGREFGTLDAVVVSADCDASLRLYYVLREIIRVEPQTHIPPVYLVDILHLPRATTTRYNRVRVGQLVDVLQGWTGASITNTALENAVRLHDEIRWLQRKVSALRHAQPARLTGSEYLAVMGAATRLPLDEYRVLLTTLLASTDQLPVHDELRVFLTGSSHDDPGVYRAIEAQGAVIVGEDHDWGELLTEREVGAATLDAIAERYQHNGPTSQRSSIRQRATHTATAAAGAGAEVLLSYTRDKDEAPLWDFAAQQAAAGMPAVMVSRQPYGAIDAGDLAEALDLLREPRDAA